MVILNLLREKNSDIAMDWLMMGILMGEEQDRYFKKITSAAAHVIADQEHANLTNKFIINVLAKAEKIKSMYTDIDIIETYIFYHKDKEHGTVIGRSLIKPMTEFLEYLKGKFSSDITSSKRM